MEFQRDCTSVCACMWCVCVWGGDELEVAEGKQNEMQINKQYEAVCTANLRKSIRIPDEITLNVTVK